MTELLVWSALPSNLPAWEQANGRDNMARLYAGNAIELVVDGASATVTAWVWLPVVGWRKHPSGIELADEESYHRLVLGELATPTVRYLAVTSVSSDVRVYVQEVRY